MIRSLADVEEIRDDEFPCLLETHLHGQEFSCEVFVHNGKVRFMNITEYVHLGALEFRACLAFVGRTPPANIEGC